jgi:hypothetical protein
MMIVYALLLVILCRDSFASSDEVKVSYLTQCLRHCRGVKKGRTTVRFSSDYKSLKAHYEQLMLKTAPFRPQSRSASTVYQGYLGPRLEDHFMQYFINEPFSLFAPIVPLFIHWTEVKFGNAGGGPRALGRILRSLLRKDVIYFTVTSDWTRNILKAGLRGFDNVLIASSKGDPQAHIILPHLFHYQSPGFSEMDGLPLTHAPAASAVITAAPVAKPEGWRFKGYEGYLRAPTEPLPQNLSSVPTFAWVDSPPSANVRPDLLAQKQKQTQNQPVSPISITGSIKTGSSITTARVGFVGDLTTCPCRQRLDAYFRSKLADAYAYQHYPPHAQCRDPSVPTGTSPCWRVAMLSADLTLCPVGSAPVSYRLYEALQQGGVPVYFFDDRGAYVPYNGTAADLRAGLGFVLPFNQMPTLRRLIHGPRRSLGTAELRARRQRILGLRDSHFTPSGVALQLGRWSDPNSLFY